MKPIIKTPSAWIPIVLSLAMLAFIFISIGIAAGRTPVREADEGVGAHLFQLWLVLEFFLVAFFAIKWLPKAPKQALLILAFQILAVFASCFPVFYFNL